MRGLIILLMILLMIGTTLLFIGFVMGPSIIPDDQAANFAPVYCAPGQTLTRFIFDDRTRRAPLLWCLDAEEQSFPAIDRNIATAVIGYFIAFTIPLFLLIVAASVGRRSRISKIVPEVTITRGGIPTSGAISASMQTLFDTLQKGMDQMQQFPQQPESKLTDVLTQLEQARKNNLISEDEFQRLRKEALDKLV